MFKYEWLKPRAKFPGARGSYGASGTLPSEITTSGRIASSRARPATANPSPLADAHDKQPGRRV